MPLRMESNPCVKCFYLDTVLQSIGLSPCYSSGVTPWIPMDGGNRLSGDASIRLPLCHKTLVNFTWKTNSFLYLGTEFENKKKLKRTNRYKYPIHLTLNGRNLLRLARQSSAKNRSRPLVKNKLWRIIKPSKNSADAIDPIVMDGRDGGRLQATRCLWTINCH